MTQSKDLIPSALDFINIPFAPFPLETQPFPMPLNDANSPHAVLTIRYFIYIILDHNTI